MRTYIPDGYEVSKLRYQELLLICRQYSELKQKRNECYYLKAPIVSDMPRSGAVTSAVERAAESALKYTRKIEAIEQAAREAIGDSQALYVPLLKNVTQGVSWEYLCDCPCGRRMFYETRRRFFWLLDKKL